MCRWYMLHKRNGLSAIWKIEMHRQLLMRRSSRGGQCLSRSTERGWRIKALEKQFLWSQNILERLLDILIFILIVHGERLGEKGILN